MSKKVKYFASESVCSGHPDKVCDQISDSILDAVLAKDPNGRVAVEALVANDHIVLAGEVSSSAKVDFEKIARQTIKELGYIHPEWGFSYKSPIENYIHTQSIEIAVGVDNDGAGDQGMMFGFAVNESEEFMPLPITIAHELTALIDESRENNSIKYLRPDGKAQVVVKYDENDNPIGIEHVTIAVPHDENIKLNQVRKDITDKVINPILDKYGYTISSDKIVINGTGVWNTPGPSSDCGLTGRKIVVDGYGGYSRVGGGAFSGKDPSKVDRSGAYAARYIAKNIVANKLADRVEVSLAYYIGAKYPVLSEINTFGTEKIDIEKLNKIAAQLLSPSVKNIVDSLNLKRPIYKETARNGHFGKKDFPWEKVSKILTKND